MRTQLYTTAASIRAEKAEGVAKQDAKTPRYHLRAGRDYLHWSAGFLTPERKHAWMGTVDQARACRRTFDAAAGCKLRAIVNIPTHIEEVQ